MRTFPRRTIFRHEEPVRLADQRPEPPVVNLCQLNAHPASRSDIRRPEEGLRILSDKAFLQRKLSMEQDETTIGSA